MSQNPPDLNHLFQTAHAEGLLSSQSLQALNIIDIGAQIQAGSVSYTHLTLPTNREV